MKVDMPQSEPLVDLSNAVEDFYKARRRAKLELILSKLRKKPTDLLQYDEVRKRFQVLESSAQQLKEIPLSSIVGTVGRYADFSRQLLPLKESDRERWARVRYAVGKMQGLPPIEVYEVGEVYFILDGHHRASVARELGATFIEAYVRKVQVPVPLSSNDSIDDVILKAERVDFLSATHFTENIPGADIQVSLPTSYQKLSEHIFAHRYMMDIDEKREVPLQEAVKHWYTTTYLPVIEVIRGIDLLNDFRDRTEADLYIWVVDYRKELQEKLGLKVDTAVAAADILNRFSPDILRAIRRIAARINDALLPDEFEFAPPPGTWREQREKSIRSNNLFKTILVAITGGQTGWNALEYGLTFAQKEGAFLGGLHVLTDSIGNEEKNSIVEEFSRRCSGSGVENEISFERGKITRLLNERSYWADLLVLNMNHPPPFFSFTRFRSGLRTLIRKRKTPILTVPPAYHGNIQRMLLAYGGGRNSDEALFVAAYLARKWNLDLNVVVVDRKNVNADELLKIAKEYLESHGVPTARYFILNGSPAQAILLQGEQLLCDLILMGGYEGGYFSEIVFGSTVDRLLLGARCPVLICH
jgi:nucleotide-binding universal stress UspA family protein